MLRQTGYRQSVMHCANSTEERWSNLINIKVDFRERNVIREDERHFLVTRASIYSEYTSILNVPNSQDSEYINLKLEEQKEQCLSTICG
jgi:hypothetical protein